MLEVDPSARREDRRLNNREFPLAENCRYRIALGVEYNGSSMHGWQRQQNSEVVTVQGCLERAVGIVANTPVKLYCAGRTDAGVHATGQVAHFDVPLDRGVKAWVSGVNSNLPASVRVKWAKTVDTTFHARHSATYRRYEYHILNTPVSSAIRAGLVTWHRYPLDEARMNFEAQSLLGENNFSSFQAAACQSRTPMRYMEKISVRRDGDELCISVQANAFLLHMVRNITGALLEVGAGRQADGYMGRLLALQDREQAPPTAKPDGLYLVEVGYPDGLLGE